VCRDVTESRDKLQETIAAELRKVAPGTRLREALDMLISARAGALIISGDMSALEHLCNGGFVIDMPFTPQRLFELAKMDGAILLDADCARILRANVHLVPDPALPTSETGMRHRTAERVSRETDALVIAISHRRNVVNLYLQGRRVTLDNIDVLLAKANQAIQTLQNYRQRLDELLERLTLLEFQDLVTLADVAEVLSRFETLRRVQREVGRYTLQLGTEGRLVRMQSDELAAGVSEQYALVVRDYVDDPSPRRVAAVRDRLSELPPDRLLEPEAIAHELGLTVAEHAEQHLRSRGYRALAQIPMLPGSVIGRIVERFGTLSEIARSSIDELDAVDGVGERRARAVHTGLARVKAHVSL
jgi:diadenylate cyclase